MVSNGLLKRGTYKTARVSLIGWKQILATAPDETKQFSSARPGAAPWTMIARSYLKLRNWRPSFVGHWNLRLSHRSRARPVSQRCVGYGPIDSWIGFRKYWANTIFSLPSLSFLGFARRGRAFLLAWPCPPSCKVTSPIW